MSFIDDLKKEENIYNHSIEDIIILKYIDKSTEIHGYVKNNRDIYGFKFVKENYMDSQNVIGVFRMSVVA